MNSVLDGEAYAVWSVGFVSDARACGRRFRSLNVVDDFSRDALHIEVGTSTNSARLVRILEQTGHDRGLPQVLRTDNGSGFVGETFIEGPRAGIQYIQP